MDVLRTDVVSLWNVDFSSRLSRRDVEALQARAPPAPTVLSTLLRESFEWAFYGERIADTVRVDLAVPAGVPGGRGATLLAAPDLGVGVYSIWQSFGAEVPPLDAKRRSHQLWDVFEPEMERLPVPVVITDRTRHHPLAMVQAAASDLGAWCREHAETLGRVFTGDSEREPREQLARYVDGNLSGRSYERLLLRWTDGLAIYARDVSEEDLTRTFFRAFQIDELCILVRGMLDRLVAMIDQTAGRRLAWMLPWAGHRLLDALARLEQQLVISPPVQSVEAERLVDEAYRAFGLQRVLDAARHDAELLDRRQQWNRALAVGGIGVLAYLADKLKAFELIAR